MVSYDIDLPALLRPVVVTSIIEHVVQSAVRFISGFIYTPIYVCRVTNDPLVRPAFCF